MLWNPAAAPGQTSVGKSAAASHTPVPAHAVLRYESRPANVLTRAAQENPRLSHRVAGHQAALIRSAQP